MNRNILRDRMRKVFSNAKGLQRILLVNTNSEDPNFLYMTDLQGGLFEGSLLLVTKKDVTLFTSPLEYGLAKEQLKGVIKIVNLDTKEKFDILAKEVKGRAIGANLNFLPYNSYARLKMRLKPRSIADVSNAFETARSVKDPEEIKRIKEANRITKKAIALLQKRLRVGMTEKDAAMIFDNLILELGADGNSFPSIVCFGRNAAFPHHSPDDTRLRYGDFVLIDVGCKVRNYCSDVTRTTIFGSDARKIKDFAKKKRMLDIVKEAQHLAIDTIKVGKNGSVPHMAAQKCIDSADKGAYKGTFIHSLGHSIGIEVHDGSGRFLSPGSDLILREGMVTSVEPGIYLEGFGGVRFEDDILVTKKGAVIL